MLLIDLFSTLVAQYIQTLTHLDETLLDTLRPPAMFVAKALSGSLLFALSATAHTTVWSVVCALAVANL